MPVSYLVTKIRTRTSRGQSSAIVEAGKNAVTKTGTSTTSDNTKRSVTGTKVSGARSNTRTTLGSNGGKGTVANTGTSTAVQQEHESFSIQFSVKMKSALVDPDVTNSPPPLTTPGPGPGI